LADNSYYLGFIFTQFALVLGFLPPVLFGSDIGPEDVLHYFGVAIGASMIGLVARTLFVQTGQTLSGYNERNEREVEALAREVSERSRAVLGQFDLLAREVRQAREQSATAFAENTTTISRIMAAGADQIAEVQRRIVDDIAQARSAFRSGLDADSAGHADLFRKHSDALGAQFEAHAQAALQRARGAVDDFEASARTAVEQREQMAFTVSKDLAIALEAIHGHTEAVGEQTDAFREGARAVGQAANEVVQRSLAAQSNLVSSVEEAAARLRQTLGSLPGQLAAVNEAVGATTQALETGATALEAFSRLAPTVDALGGQVASVTAKVDAAAQTLEAGAQSMRDTVGEVRSNAEREAETLRADLDQSVAALRTTLDSFRTALSQIRV
ncbi:MAG: hypothetical protein K0R83_764, partial [Caulobacter sp.]|nr:hypothetical protein [Caulobacter sp.]